MKKQNLQNEELDRIGLKLLDAARMPVDEIDQVAAAPHLFNAIQARIRIEGSQRAASEYVGVRIDLPVFQWRKIGIAFAGISAFLIGGWAAFMNSEPDVVQNVQPQIIAEDPKVRDINIIEQPAAVETNSVPVEHRTKSAAKRYARSRIARQRSEIEVPGEFYSLTYAGDDGEEDGQIVRVVLPRSALFAMGIDIPVENEKDKVKTDLLIGSDGVTRAVRIVN